MTRLSRHAWCPALALTASAVMIALGAAPLNAQSPSGGDTLSAVSVADSLVVLNQIKDQVIARSGDSGAWHRLGLIAWSLADRARAPEPPNGLDATKLGRLADSSLRMAAELAPLNIKYRIDVGRFLLASGVAITRTAARGHFEKALEMARVAHAPALHAEAALAFGRTFWWRYDVFANRRLPAIEGFAPNSVTDAMQPLARTAAAAQEWAVLTAAAEYLSMQSLKPLTISDLSRLPPSQIEEAVRATEGAARARTDVLPQTSMKAARDLIETSTAPLPPDLTGAADFERAFRLFDEAYSADPTYPGAFRARAMIYADRSLWRELESVARGHVAVYPRDSLALMTLGLALHRQEKEVAAKTAFDSAFAVMDPRERDRLDYWRRVTPTGSGLSFADDATLKSAAQLYWMLSSPFWADEGNDTKIEFLSRVTFSELRWTIEEFHLSGADTDRGDIHVRYGPPEKIAVLGPRGSDNAADVVTYWMYSSGLMFAFRGMPTFGTAHTAYGDGGMVAAIEQVQPVRWDNLTAPTPDSLPVQVARFRANRDSVDVVVAAALVEPDSIRKTMSVIGDVKRFFWLVVPGSDNRYSSTGAVDTAGVYSVSQRIAPGSFLYRVEEFAETAKRGGRATGAIAASTAAFPLFGFGISDILLGTNAVPLTRAQTRWGAASMAPLAGSIARGADLAVLWENYDFGQQDGNTTYEVAVTLKRIRSAAGRIAAKITNAVDLTARTQSENDRVVITFERTHAHADAFADEVILALGDTPAGTYSLTLELTDRATGKKATRTTTVVIREK